MSTRRIIEAFERWRAATTPLVLATVYETLGSTYSKAGERIVIAGNGDYQGLVSGGCLEGDLAERARGVLAGGRATQVTYDLRDEADLVFGLGIGCNGLIRVLLQPLSADSGYEPFASLSRLMLGRGRAVTATVIESSDAASEPGATAIRGPGDAFDTFGSLPPDATVREQCDAVLRSGRALLESSGNRRVLYAPLATVPRVLILGAGFDAVPLVNIAAELGWLTTICDHRPVYLARGDLERADERRLVDPRRLPAELDAEAFDAVLVMSHHLDTDERYLRALAGTATRYIGVLGPRERRVRLLARLGADATRLELRLHGPVGLDIGGNSPETIALSILAEIQAAIAGRVDPG